MSSKIISNTKNLLKFKSDVLRTSIDDSQSGESNESYNLKEKYEFIQVIGTGTFGKVFLVKDKSNMTYSAMKVMKIADICRLKQVKHIHSEKDVLTGIQHPFIVSLYWTNHDATYLYVSMEYLPGGELFSYLRTQQQFTLSVTSFYAAEIVLGLEYLHINNIIYRDLKPENLILDFEGNLKLIDFGFSKRLGDGRTWTLCGTPEYLAPEIIQGKGHNKAVDWWALGILVFEMLAGHPPFYDTTPFGIYAKALAGTIKWHDDFDLVAKDLVKKLLVFDRSKRLGAMKKDAADVKDHKFFSHLDWEDIYFKKAPIIPSISHPGDAKNFENYPDDHLYLEDSLPATIKDQLEFQDF